MHRESGLTDAAQLFKVLGNESRLWLLLLLDREPRSVSRLAEASTLSQPLVSQHLRTLRHGGLVTATRAGKEVIYRVSDGHVAHVIRDALAHVLEPPATGSADPSDTRQSDTRQEESA